MPDRDASGPLVYAVDHCFSMRGQGTVMTGTVLSGSVSVNDVNTFFNLNQKPNMHDHVVVVMLL